MKDNPIKGLVMRTGALRTPSIGYILCANLEKERRGIAHTTTFRWSAGELKHGTRNYDAHSACVISYPEAGLVDVCGQGFFAVVTHSGNLWGDIIEDSQPPPPNNRTGGIRSVHDICGKAYAVGLRGVVYRLDSTDSWTRIDDGLPQDFNGQAIHGFSPNELYAVGRKGAMWQYDGSSWTNRELPTDETLTSVECAGDGQVYAAGHGGALLRGREESWQLLEQDQTTDDF